MKYFSLAFIVTVLICCKSQPLKKHNPVTAVIQQTTVTGSLNYDSCKKQILLIKQKNRANWIKLSKAEKERIVTAAVTEAIIPNWIGTKWDYNGTSQTPQQGTIACGYFVTTVLQDAGLTLARTRLAQCASEQMITTLVQPKYVKRFSNIDIENFISAIYAEQYGLYIVGLDNHTGFIYHNGKEIYFIHSTFAGSKNVQKEKAINSWVLKQSKYKVLAKLSADEKILDHWIN